MIVDYRFRDDPARIADSNRSSRIVFYSGAHSPSVAQVDHERGALGVKAVGQASPINSKRVIRHRPFE